MEYKLKEKEKLEGKPESEESFKSSSSIVQDAVIQINEHGLIIYWNKSAEKLFGLSQIDVLNKNLHQLIAPERYLKTFKEAFIKFRNSGQGAAIGKTLELKGKKKNGEEFPIELSLSSFQVNGEWNAVGIIRDITKRRKAENTIKERIKELTCLYELSKIIEEKDITKEEILKKSVNLIPPAWQYPDITCARIVVDNQEYKTKNFKETEWKQASDIIVTNNKVGSVEVYFLEEKPEFDEGPFLKEERYLINAMAERLGKEFERIDAEIKVKESEEWLYTTLQSIGDAVIATDSKGNVIFLNSVAESLTGWKQSEAIKKPVQEIFKIINKESREEVENPVYRVIREGVIVGLANHTVLISKDGREIPIDDSGAPIKDKEGKINGVVLTFRDITERRKAENTIKERIKELTCLYELSKIIEEKDITKEEILKKSVNLIPPAWQYPDITCARIVVDNQEYKTKSFKETEWKQASDIFVNTNKVGLVEVYYLEKTPEFDEGPFLKEERNLINGISEILFGALELKLTEEKLKLSEAKHRNIINNLDAAFYQVVLDGRLINHNPAYNIILGYETSQNLKNTNVKFLWENPNLREVYLEQLLKDGYVKNYICHILKNDGTKIVLQVNSHIIRDKEGKPVRIDGTFIDITEKFVLEQRFRERLEREVKHRTKDLKELLEKQKLYLDQIEKSSRFKTEFLATMSHELRTPLNAIIGFTDLLIEGVFGELNKEQSEYIKDIDDSSNHLLDMISRILNISKIESGQATLKIEEIQLNNLIAQVISILKPLYIEKDIKWVLVGLKKEQFIFADRIKFKQIIYNLLSNAIKFTKKGRITFEFKENKQDWEFIIKDTGIGISENDFDIIFKDFKRVKSEYVQATQGTGLGLALTKRLVNIQGGNISFSSKLEKGTTFTFNLPKAIRKKLANVKKIESFLNKL